MTNDFGDYWICLIALDKTTFNSVSRLSCKGSRHTMSHFKVVKNLCISIPLRQQFVSISVGLHKLFKYAGVLMVNI